MTYFPTDIGSEYRITFESSFWLLLVMSKLFLMSKEGLVLAPKASNRSQIIFHLFEHRYISIKVFTEGKCESKSIENNP